MIQTCLDITLGLFALTRPLPVMFVAGMMLALWRGQGGVLPDSPRWLMLDEPVSALDIGHQLLVMGLARDFAAGGGAPGGRAAGQPAAPAAARHYFQASRQYRRRILVQSGETLVSLALEDVAYFHKALVVRVVTHGGRAYPVSQSLDELEQTLDPTVFFRVNRQVIARAQAIARIDRGFKSKLELTLTPPLAEACTVSQERAGALRDWLDR